MLFRSDTTVVRVRTWWEKAIMGTDAALAALAVLSLGCLILAARKYKKAD